MSYTDPTRGALREALADSEAFVDHVPATPEEDDEGHAPVAIKRRSNFHASPSLLMTCRSRASMTDPCTTQGISGQLKLIESKSTLDQC